jgi:cellulase/cellobiase CelA1
LSNVCSAGVCRLLVGGLAVVPVVDTDWGGGYCVHLNVTNVEDIPTINWSATMNTNQSTIFTSWNATFTPNSGAISVTPSVDFRVIDPSETDVGIGFCANRNNPSSGLLPFTTGATAVY